MISVAILGAGPAGMSCALWLHNLGCHPVLLEQANEAGGLLRQNVLTNDWVLGQGGQTGTAMAEHFAQHLAVTGIDTRFGVTLKEIISNTAGFSLVFAGQDEALQVQALVIAVGTRVRGQELLAAIPGVASVPDQRLIVGPAAFGQPERFTGKHVLVVGGGDNAHEFVRFTAPHAGQQSLLVRSTRRAQQVQRQAVDALMEQGKLSLYEQTRIVELAWRNEKMIAAISTAGAPTRELVADFLVLQTGYQPNSDRLLTAFAPAMRSALQVDDEGYLRTDHLGRTGVAGVYTIGDISNRDTPCVVTALAAGATAARDIERTFREAA